MAFTTVSGQVTNGATGNVDIDLGVVVTDLDVYTGARDGVTETVGYSNYGHADKNNSFAVVCKDGKSVIDTAKYLVTYDSSGNRVNEATFVHFAGTVVRLNFTHASTSWPFYLVGRG